MERKSEGLKRAVVTVLKQNGIKCLLLLFVMLCICGYSAENTYASYNFSNAREITVNHDVNDSVINGSVYHQNFYRFTTTQAGFVIINFSNPLQRDSEEYWKVTLYGSNYEELYAGSVYGNQTRTELTPIGIPAGTYYIRVASAAEQQVKSSDGYTLRAAFTVSETWEKELNDNYLSATPMYLNTDHYGTIRYGSDFEKDYYRLDVTQPGCLDISLSVPQQKNANEYWKVYLYNSSYAEICNMTVYGYDRYVTFPTIGVDRGNYFIQVTSASWSEASSKDTYTLRANFKASDVWEKELNDDFTTATDIHIGTSYFGTINDGSDYERDYFKFDVATAGKHRIQVKTPNLRDSSIRWKLYLYDAAYTELLCTDIFGNETFQYADQNLSVGAYYIQITSANWNLARSKESYELSVLKLNEFGQPESPTQPTYPTQPATSTLPTQPVTPTYPTQTTTPALPTRPVTPTYPTQPVAPTQPTQPSEPQDEYYHVEWNVASATLQVGQSTDALVAEVTGDDEVELYTSSNTSVVTIESNGIINAHKAGEAVIRAITKHGSTAIINIKVQKKAITTKGIIVDTKKVNLEEGETYELDAEVTPITSPQEIRYTSVNSKIASVSKNGVIKAKAKGTTTIKVKSGSKTVKVTVTVP